MKKSFFIILGLTALVFADYTRNNMIVTDNETNLQWQDDSDVVTSSKIWTEALVYCDNLVLGGYDDWRLPNINELNSLITDSTVTINSPSKYIDGIFQNHSIELFYWTSTTSTEFGLDDKAWSTSFYIGMTFANPKDYPSPVRCVR